MTCSKDYYLTRARYTLTTRRRTDIGRVNARRVRVNRATQRRHLRPNLLDAEAVGTCFAQYLDYMRALEEFESRDEGSLLDLVSTKVSTHGERHRTHPLAAFHELEERLVHRRRDLATCGNDLVGGTKYRRVRSEVFRLLNLSAVLERAVVRRIERWELERSAAVLGVRLVDPVDLIDGLADDGVQGAQGFDGHGVCN